MIASESTRQLAVLSEPPPADAPTQRGQHLFPVAEGGRLQLRIAIDDGDAAGTGERYRFIDLAQG